MKNTQGSEYGERKSILDLARIKIHHAAMLPDSHLKEEYLDNSINQYSEALLQKVREVIKDREKNVGEGKTRCDCPCKGPFCNNLIHICDKPELHYPQRNQAIVDIENNLLRELRTKLAKLEGEI